MGIKTLKDELKEVADYANTATQVTNRIVKLMREEASQGNYDIELNSYIPREVYDKVLENLQNDRTQLRIKEYYSGVIVRITWED